MINKLLYNNFCWNEEKEVIKILNLYSNIDVFYKSGIFFEFAISKGNVDVCKALLNYFENKQFPEKNKEYNKVKSKLIELLENITSNMDISSEMETALSPYISFNNSLDNRSDNSMFEEIDFIETTENKKKTTPMKKSHSTGDLSNSTNIFSSDSSSNHSSGKKNNIIDDMFLHDKNHNFEIEKVEDIHIIGETQSL